MTIQSLIHNFHDATFHFLVFVPSVLLSVVNQGPHSPQYFLGHTKFLEWDKMASCQLFFMEDLNNSCILHHISHEGFQAQTVSLCKLPENPCYEKHLSAVYTAGDWTWHMLVHAAFR